MIGAQTFTWKASRASAGQVTIGASAAAACTNLITALNTDIPTVVVASQGTGTTVVVTDLTPRAAASALTFTENSANLTMNGSGTLGGTTAGTAPTVTPAQLTERLAIKSRLNA